MVMFLLSFVKGVQIRGGESISASGFGPGGPILGGSKSAGTPAPKQSAGQADYFPGEGFYVKCGSNIFLRHN